jgi:biopolymer transport protein ExbB
MLPSYHDWVFTLGQFFQTGGWVLYLILWVSFLMFTLILERLSYCVFKYPKQRKDIVTKLSNEGSYAKKLSIVCDLDLSLSSQFRMIKNLITLCPLIGLLGTVTGMIQVFDSLALYGTGNPRMMAAGVASATFPTMTGMAAAVAGLLFYNRLYRWSDTERNNLRQALIKGTNV